MSATSLISSAVDQIYGQVSGKQKANEWYKIVVPEIHEDLKQGKSLNDPQLRKLVDALIELAPVGARRRNFERRYTEDKESLLSLPHDPNLIMYGYWW